jgi:hypothetical protein
MSLQNTDHPSAAESPGKHEASGKNSQSSRMGEGERGGLTVCGRERGGRDVCDGLVFETRLARYRNDIKKQGILKGEVSLYR